MNTLRTRPSILVHLLAFSLILTLPLVALIAYNIHSEQQADGNDAIELLQPLRVAYEQQIKGHLAHLEERLRPFSTRAEDRPLNPAEILAGLQAVLASESPIQRLVLVDPHARKIADTLDRHPGFLADPAETPWLRGCVTAEGPHLSDAFFDPASQRWQCAFSFPWHAAGGEKTGTLIAMLDLATLSQHFFSAQAERKMTFCVFDSEGTLLMRSRQPDKWIGSRSLKIHPIYKQRGGDRALVDHFVSTTGQAHTFTIGPIPDTPWSIAILIPDDVIFAAAHASQHRSLWYLGGFLAGLALLSVWFAYYLTRPITSLTQSARSIRDGGPFRPAEISGPEEIRETARIFNDLVTARDRIKLSLAASEQRYRTIIDLAPFFIYAKDAEGRFVLANQRVAQNYGTTPDQLIGKKDADFSNNHEQIKRFLQENEWVLANNQPMHIAEEPFIDGTGRKRYLTTTKIPFIYAEDGQRGVLGISVDITELVLAARERQLMEKKILETQKLESLGVMAGGIAHDFNNLLTGILGNVGLIRLQSPRDAGSENFLIQIEKSAQRAAELCKQMLVYSGSGRHVSQPVDLNALLRETHNLLGAAINKQSQLQFELAPLVPVFEGDQGQLRQLLMNLVMNASEAIGERHGNITLRSKFIRADEQYLAAALLTPELKPGDYVCLEVADDGPGMSAETIARIFDPFFTTKFVGRGLGLAAVLGIMRSHHGAIRVYSELGQGTTIKLYFPTHAAAATPVVASPPSDKAWRGSGRALIVDDEQTVRQVASRIMTRLGYTVETAADGLAAVEMFRQNGDTYGVVLLDLMMPYLNGEETFRQMRQMRPDVRIILMSGFNKLDAVQHFLGKGLAGFVQKPFDLETLRAELQRVAETPVRSD